MTSFDPHAVAVDGVGFGHKAIALEGFRIGVSVTVSAGPMTPYVPSAAGRVRLPEYYLVTIRVWFQGIMQEKVFRVKRKTMESVVCRRVLQRTMDISVDAILKLREDEEITVKATLL